MFVPFCYTFDQWKSGFQHTTLPQIQYNNVVWHRSDRQVRSAGIVSIENNYLIANRKYYGCAQYNYFISLLASYGFNQMSQDAIIMLNDLATVASFFHNTILLDNYDYDKYTFTDIWHNNECRLCLKAVIT